MLVYGEWSDNRWFNAICALIAAGRLALLDNYTIDILDNTRIGGNGTIGIGVADVQWDAETATSRTVKVPVYAHDVYKDESDTEIEVNMFSVLLEYDSTAVAISSVYGGDWGTWGTDIAYTQSTGKLNVIGSRADGQGIKEDMILFYIDFDISQSYTSNQDIPLILKSLASQSQYVGNAYTLIQNYTTMLKYNDYTAGRSLAFIYPVSNKSGSIVISGNKTIKGTVAEAKPINDVDPPTGIYAGTSKTRPGLIGAVPIAINLNEKDVVKGLTYNKFSCDIEIDDSSFALGIQLVIPRDNWEFTKTITNLPNGNKLIHIDGTADKVLTKGQTVGAIEYLISSSIDEYNVPLIVTNAQIYLDDTIVNDNGSNGRVYYGVGEESGSGGDKTNNSLNASGGMWSSAEGLTWMNYGGYSYPVYVYPGDNDVYIEVPFTPDDAQNYVTIESPGYVLIKAGFILEYKNDGSTQGKVVTIPYTAMDKVRFNDIWDVYKKGAKNYDIDFIDGIIIDDIELTSKDRLVIKVKDMLDMIGFSDFTADEKVTLRNKAFETIDMVGLSDVNETQNVQLTIKNSPDADTLAVNDMWDIELIKGE